MKDCRFTSCPDHYERRQIVHHEPIRDRTVVIDGVPADVCNVCGDILLPPESARRLETGRDLLEAGQATTPDRAELHHFDRAAWRRPTGRGPGA